MLPVKIYNDPVLRKKALTVKKITEEDKRFIADMIDTMYAQDGLGLAATQVGVSKRICVISATASGGNYTQKKGEELIIINPKIIKKSGVQTMEEGCLSLPGITSEVRRAFKLTFIFNDINGRETKMKAEGLLARIIQHETDHLDGILFIDRLNFWRRRKILKKLKKCA